MRWHHPRMTIKYVTFEVSMDSLALPNLEELEVLRLRLEGAAEAVHPGIQYSGDVEVEIIEHAGEPVATSIPPADRIEAVMTEFKRLLKACEEPSTEGDNGLTAFVRRLAVRATA
jgi:hypothetical protein